ncbi:MAG: hypothetical protein ACYCXT_04050 [Acidiferrobacteraceae bacterium]
MNDSVEARTGAELYQQLDQSELLTVAGSCALYIADVRQEAWLLCLRVASGKSDYCAALGSVRQYVMGRLWGLTLRWRLLVRLRIEDQPEEEEGAPAEVAWEQMLSERSLYAPDPEAEDPLHRMLVREEEQEYEAACAQTLSQWVAARRLTRGDRTFVELVLGGAPIDEIAELYGLTPRAVRYRCERLGNRFQEMRRADTVLAARTDCRAVPGNGG